MNPYQYTPIDFSQYQPQSYYPEGVVDTSGYYVEQGAQGAAGGGAAGGIGKTAGSIAGTLGGKYVAGQAIGAGKAALGIGSAGAATTAGAAPIAATAGGAAGAGVTAPLTFAGGSAGAFGTSAGAAPAVPTIVGAEGAGAAAGSAGSTLGYVAAPLAIAAGGYGLYDLAANTETSELKAGFQGTASGAAAGAGIGTLISPGPGTVVGGAIGAGVGLLSGLASSFKGFRTGKGQNQLDRDKVRKGLVQSGAIGKDYKLNLPDGKSFDIGKDGSDFKNYSDVDFTQPGIGDVVAAANPLAAAITGGDPKLQSDFAGYFANAATKNAKNPEDAFNNLRATAAQLKLDPQTLHQSIEQLKPNLTEEQYNVYQGSIDTLFNGYYDQKDKESYFQIPDHIKQRLIKT